MNNLPGTPELLRIARETLLAELRPLVPAHARYALAMVANAMAIAAREAEVGDAPAAAALARLASLYERPVRELAGDALHRALAEADRELIVDIRAGRFDEGRSQHNALIEHLRSSVKARLMISNPKSLPRPLTPDLSPEGREEVRVSLLPPGEGSGMRETS